MSNDVNTDLIEELFANKNDNVKEIYHAIIDMLNSIGEYKIEVKKTSIHVVKKSAFLGINPKKKWMDINIVTTHPIENEKITKVEQVSKNRFHNNLRIMDKSELDSEVISMLKDAYNK